MTTPAVFHKGIALSVWQNSSDRDSQWTQFAKDRHHFGQGRFRDAWDHSNNFWQNYASDIKLVKEMGGNAFRFSFEWARIEPVQGQVDASAIARYHQILDCLDAHGIIPNATLHHFTHPLWFERMGGFCEEANVPLFVHYCQTMFHHFGSRIRLWATFNEPTCFAFCGYIMGIWAPGSRGRMITAGRVLGNTLRAHVAAYQAIKAMPRGDEAQVGMVHQHIRFAAKCGPVAQLWVRPLVRWMTYWFATSVVLEFFRTGWFRWRSPFLGTVISFQVPSAPHTLDWWGINYYTRPCINGLFQLSGMGPDEPNTDMGMPMVPTDLHFHIADAAHALGQHLPIYITETGLADKRDLLRGRLIDAYYAQVLRALADGYNVCGVYYWTLMDNIEWHHGFTMKFGLYEWSPRDAADAKEAETGAPPRVRLREGSRALQRVHAAWPDSLPLLREYAKQAVADGASSDSGVVAVSVRGLARLASAPSGAGTDLHTSLLPRNTELVDSAAAGVSVV